MVHKTRRQRTRRSRSNRKSYRRGGGVVTSQQFFNPDVYPPYTNAPAVSTYSTETAIRPVLHSTFKVGGKRRRLRGGFSPSIMGSFISNAEKAIVPLALYSAYHLMPKKGRNIFSVRKRRSGRK